MSERKLVTLRLVDEIRPIEKADAIEVAVFGGWEVVTKKGEFKAGDRALYFEIDSFIPDGNPNWQFLIDKSSRTFEGKKGHKLRTIKLRGQLSQGLALKPELFPEVIQYMNTLITDGVDPGFEYLPDPFDLDYSEVLGVVKWEAPESAAVLSGMAKGNFPEFIRKSDQNRCQNYVQEIFGYEPTRHVNDLQIDPKVSIPEIGQDVRITLADSSIVDRIYDDSLIALFKSTNVDYWQPAQTKPAKGDRNRKYEVSLKMDGSSVTVFIKALAKLEQNAFGRFKFGEESYEFGICSRNLQLKISEDNANNQFIKTAFELELDIALKAWLELTGRSIAIQGELMGPGIQGNREGFTDFRIYVYNIFDIDKQEYMLPTERKEVFNKLKSFSPGLQHCWILHESVTMDQLGITNIKELLTFAEGRSLVNPVREGLVFKDVDSQMSFKAISNLYLLETKD